MIPADRGADLNEGHEKLAISDIVIEMTRLIEPINIFQISEFNLEKWIA